LEIVAEKDRTERQLKVAVKIFSWSNESQNFDQLFCEDVQLQSFQAEALLMSQLEHPNIVRMYECFSEDSRHYIVMEFCAGGELFAEVVKRARSGGIPEPEACWLFRQMLYAVSYLHCQKILHRDIKCENFLLLGGAGTPEGKVVKLCDFGSSVRLCSPEQRSMEHCGTLSYTAPEVYSQLGASLPSDLWSLGVVLYIILVGANPFKRKNEDTPQDIKQYILSGSFNRKHSSWLKLSAAARELVQQFLQVEESLRIDFSEAFEQPWLLSLPLDFPECSGALQSFVLQAVGLLARFQELDALQKLLLTLCARLLPDTELFHQSTLPWYNLFMLLDSDGDGRLSLSEFAAGLWELLASNANGDAANEKLWIDGLVLALDVDNSGAIEWVEWAALALFSSPNLLNGQEPLQTLFRQLDSPTCDSVICPRDLVDFCDPRDLQGSQEAAAVLLRPWARTSARNGAAEPALDFADMRRALEDLQWDICRDLESIDNMASLVKDCECSKQKLKL